MSYFFIRTEWDFVLARVCYINKWEQTTRKCWTTDNGSWHLLETDELRDLAETFMALSKMACETEKQWLIESNVLDFVKRIVGWPSYEEKHDKVMTCAWRLLFDLVINSSNHALIWMEFNEILMKHLSRNIYDNETCRYVVYLIYCDAGIAQDRGWDILKILIFHFYEIKKNGPVKEKALTTFLQHFMTDERNIGPMYQQMHVAEKRCFLYFIVNSISEPLVNGRNGYHISLELVRCICNDFISENELVSPSSTPLALKVLVLFGSFEVIAYASMDERHKLQEFDFSLMLNVVRLFKYVRSHDDMAELLFGCLQNSPKQSMKEMILSTIINLVRNNASHKEKAREAGLIEIIVDFVASERCRHLYQCMLSALVEMCQTSQLNMKAVQEIAKSKDWTGLVAVNDFLNDMKN